MKSNAIATVGVALVNLPLTVEPHPIFRITRTEMESGTSPTLARLAVAQIHPIGFTRGNHSKRASVALPDPFHSLLLTWFNRNLADPVGCRRAASNRKPFGQTRTGISPKDCAVASIRRNARVGRELRHTRQDLGLVGSDH
jgi:hypothetical protein